MNGWCHTRKVCVLYVYNEIHRKTVGAKLSGYAYVIFPYQKYQRNSFVVFAVAFCPVLRDEKSLFLLVNPFNIIIYNETIVIAFFKGSKSPFCNIDIVVRRQVSEWREDWKR